MSLSEDLVKYASELSFGDLSDVEVYGAKRSILDTVACIVGGYACDSSRRIRSLVSELGGPAESTVIGSGIKVSCANAALVNGGMARYLDYNDTYLRITDRFVTGWHPSELIPAALAVGERQRSTGQELITAVALAYEIIGRFVDAIIDRPLSSRGWHMATQAGFVVSLVGGKLLGLSREQMVNAIGIAGTHSPTLGVINAPGEESNMTRNIGIALIAQNSIIAALLAQKGFTGPRRVIEGNRGFVQTILAGDFDETTLLKKRQDPTVSRTLMKYFPVETSAQGALEAVIKLVNDHTLTYEQIERVRIEVSTRASEWTGDPVKRHPRNKETADQSLYYAAAVGIVDRDLCADSYTDDNLESPKIHELIDKITVVANPELDPFGSAGIVQIHTSDNRQFSCRVDYPKGHPCHPVTDEEIGNKFRELASQFMIEERIKEITSTVYDLEELRDTGNLMHLLVFERGHSEI